MLIDQPLHFTQDQSSTALLPTQETDQKQTKNGLKNVLTNVKTFDTMTPTNVITNVKTQFTISETKHHPINRINPASKNQNHNTSRQTAAQSCRKMNPT